MIVEALDLVGKQFGGYNILGELGRGGMAVVYKADEASLNRVVALKVISPKIAGDATMIKRFQREAQIVAGLNHPNIIHIYGIGEEEGIPYFAMEYVKGKTLDEYRASSGGVSLAQVLSIIKQVARALGDAHQAGLVHRDIKPSNIMVQDNGLVKVMDFGIAHVTEAVTRLTVEGSFLGTPTFMSPEQCEGGGIDPRSDLYSLGIVLYEILAGAPPFEAGTPASILVKIVKGEIEPLGNVRPDLPEELIRIVDKMIRTQRDDRYPDAEALLVDLEALTPIISGGVTDVHDFSQAFTGAMHAGVVPTVIATPRKKTNAAGLVGGLVAVALATGAVFWWQPWQSDRGGEPAAVASSAEQGASGDEVSQNNTGVTGGEAVVEKAAGVTPNETTVAAASPFPEVKRVSAEVDDVVSWAEDPDTVLQKETAIAASAVATLGPEGRDEVVTAGFGAASPVPVQGEAVSRPTTEPVREVPVVGSQPVEPAALKPVVEPEPVAPPPADSVFVTVRGDQGIGAMLSTAVGKTVERMGLKRSRKRVAPGDVLANVAAHELVLTSRELGRRELTFYGKRSVATTVLLSAELVRTGDEEILAGPVSEKVEYTALNMDEKIKEAAGRLMRALERDQ